MSVELASKFENYRVVVDSINFILSLEWTAMENVDQVTIIYEDDAQKTVPEVVQEKVWKHFMEVTEP